MGGTVQRPEMREFLRAQMEKCLDEAGMSKAGRELVLDSFLRDMFPGQPGPLASPRPVE
jgi:hypothetical protein